MNIAMILAGGADPKFQMSVPKQFVNVFNRPIIIYTLQAFQEHPQIDEIVVTCLNGWQEIVRAYAKQFNITKLKWIVEGGESGQASVRNGVERLLQEKERDDIVILHDAIRPMVSHEIISASIAMCRQCGMGVAAVHSQETVMYTKDGKTGDRNIARREIVRVQTPQAFRLQVLWNFLNEAVEKGIMKEWEVSSIIAKLGHKVYFSRGSDTNMKIANMEDVETFRALYSMRNKKEE